MVATAIKGIAESQHLIKVASEYWFALASLHGIMEWAWPVHMGVAITKSYHPGEYLETANITQLWHHLQSDGFKPTRWSMESLTIDVLTKSGLKDIWIFAGTSQRQKKFNLFCQIPS